MQDLYDLSMEQWCAPLLYETLRGNDCLDILPAQTRNRFRRDCLENRLRNQLLKGGLADLLRQFVRAGIEVVLLKGAATFADDLYDSLSARTMLDLDLLIRREKVATARSLLINSGYEEISDEGKVLTGIPTDGRHAHINAYRKPGTPMIVELHYNIAYGQGGRILMADEAWRHTSKVEMLGIPSLILQPTNRLLHNTVHGLIPSCAYIKGRIRLWHLLEFAYLAKRYSDEIDWRVWLDAAKKEKCTTAFLAWLLLAHKLLAIPLPVGVYIGLWSRLQAWRLKSATLLQDEGVSNSDGGQLSSIDRLCLLLHRVYYYTHLPAWVWRNVCYAEGWRNLPVRIRYFFQKLASRRSWRKI